MRFDDRLLTVLNQPAEDRHDAAVRWRQLVDLVARAGSNSASPVVADALEAIRSESPRVDEAVRAATARAIAALPLPLALLEYFASDRLNVSAPVLAAATLDAQQWRVLIAAADQETRAFIATLHPEIATEPHVEPARREIAPDTKTPSPPPPLPDRPGSPSLQDVIDRIERRRQLRAGQAAPPGEPALAAGSPALFRWECGPGGDIAWVEGAPRGPLIGRSIARQQENSGDRVDPDVVRAFAMRSPFRDAVLQVSGAGPVAGAWKISGVPAFEPADGRFAGYRGVALREVPAAPSAPARETVPHILSDPASVRELVHELKTPLNAIMGFAEIIEGQYLGPADRGYRNRATEIGRQARILLGAIDDLDFAAKLHSASGNHRERVDLSVLVERAAGELREIATKRGIDAELIPARRELFAAVEPELADRLLFRLFGALADKAEPGERLRFSAEQSVQGPQITISRPSALNGISDASLFDAIDGEEAEGGFSLRLARGLARIAGGDLVSSRDSFALLFARG